MPESQITVLDPRHFVVIKPLPIRSPTGTKVKARSRTTYSTCGPPRERVFWENYYRRQRQFSRQGYNAVNWRPYEEIGERVYLEPKILILQALGQLDETHKDDPLPTENVTVCATISENLHEPRETTDLTTPMSQRNPTRHLMPTLRPGKGASQQLRTEKQNHRAGQRSRHGAREETSSLPPCSSPHHECSSSWEAGRKMKLPVARPFTPVHYSLTSPQQDSSAREHIFRQLCCLNWLLEALTADPGGHVSSITSCWDLKDPGRSRVTIKELNKEKVVEMRWYQFVSQPKIRKNAHRPSHCVPWRLPRRAPALSAASSLATTPTAGSLSSLVQYPEESHPAGGSSDSGGSVLAESARTEREPPVSDSLQKLLNVIYETVSKELRGQQHNSSQTANSSLEDNPLAMSQKKDTPASMLKEEQSQLRIDTNNSLGNKTVQQWGKSGTRCQELCMGRLRRGSRLELHSEGGVKARGSVCGRSGAHGNAWLSVLLSSLPDWALRDPRVSKVLEKLARFDVGSSLHVWPQVFLSVLETLPPWELCCPDLCVAIEIIREHVVCMTREEYDAWLQSRVILPQRSQSAPQKR